MKFKWGVILFILLIFLLNPTFSQSSKTVEEQLASQYFQNKEYDKAVEIYDKLFDKEPTVYFYNQYLSCLIELKDYEKAEKILKSLIKKNEDTPVYQIDLGYVYSLSGKEDKSKNQYEYCIKNVDLYNPIILSEAFIKRKEYKYALKTLLKSRETSNNGYYFEIAKLYGLIGEISSEIEEYVKSIDADYSNINIVKPILQDKILLDDPNNDKYNYLKNLLYKNALKNSSNPVYEELLIWLYIQHKDFENAFLFAKALDKRYKEEGEKLYELGNIAYENKDYKIAEESYNYVISKGKDSYLYVDAKISLLDMLKEKTTSKEFDEVELNKLEKLYSNTLDEFGINIKTIQLCINLSDIKAFYLNKIDESINLLDSVIANHNNFPQDLLANCKMELASVYILNNDIWDAKLLYGQVELDFNDDVLGQEAKYLNAKLSYYIGDFNWALAKLNVLKASTSKLISNDALELSLVISDNIANDTSNINSLRMFARADLKIFQKKYSEAVVILDSISNEKGYNTLNDDIMFKKANINEFNKNYETALLLYDSIYKNYKYELLADDALFKMASIYENKTFNNEKATELYKELFMTFPDSILSNEAKRRYRLLTKNNIN